MSEVAVLGIPDPFWGEVGYAVYAVNAGHSVTEDELAAFTAAKVARYKQPKRFIQWEALPKSAYGKITKKMVRDELEARGQIEQPEKTA
ncbi:AMP-binding enzyme [Paracoccus cavernae]|uniref:AMP-binding enzyme n=1 Tax=Paracoccus cavernae TaxID=1571207 RepID=UPI0036388011